MHAFGYIFKNIYILNRTLRIPYIYKLNVRVEFMIAKIIFIFFFILIQIKINDDDDIIHNYPC